MDEPRISQTQFLLDFPLELLMHIPDGVLSPQVCAVTGALSVGAIGYSLHRLREDLGDRTVPMTGMMASLVFAGQMVNFPLSLFGIPTVSGHLIGAVLAASVLGPWAGCLAIALVLIVQCLLFADGGLAALGANIFNMAVVGAWGGYAVLSVVRRMLGGGMRGTLTGVIAASWISVMAAAAAFCLEFACSDLSDNINLSSVFALMVTFHSAIGIGEAVITGGVVSFVLSHRPDLVQGHRPERRETNTPGGVGIGRFLAAGLVAAAAVAAFLSPFASDYADGLEAVAEKNFAERAEQDPTVLVLGDYEIPAPLPGWNESPLWQKVSVSLAGLLGLLVVFTTAWLFDRSLRRRFKPSRA